MTSGNAAALRAFLGQVDQLFEDVHAPLTEWLPRLEHQLTERCAVGQLTGAQLAALAEPEALRILIESQRPLYGAGYCASEDVVCEGNPLAWWQGPDRVLLSSSTFGPGQAEIDLRRLEWYRVPAETGTPHIAGPFVDYLCSNEITITSSMPVTVGGRFAGVVCADVLVASIEPEMLLGLEWLGQAMLVNTQGRVVVSAHPGFETGDLFVEAAAASSGLEVLARSDRYPFALVAPAA